MAIVLRRLKTALWVTKIINRTTFGVHCLYISWKTNFKCKSFLFDVLNYSFPCPVTNSIRASNKTGNKLGGRSLIHGRGTKCLSSFTWIKLAKKSMLSQTPKFDCHIHNFTPLYRLWETLSGSRFHITFPQDRGVQITPIFCTVTPNPFGLSVRVTLPATNWGDFWIFGKFVCLCSRTHFNIIKI